MVIGIDGRQSGRGGVRVPARIRDTRPAAGDTAPAAPVAPAASVRLTRRGRLVVTAFLTVLIVAAFVVLGDASVATREGGRAEAVRVVEVEEGQTLWQIASSVAAPGETGEMVYRIRELNSLPGSGLVEGQELAVPLR
jgi:hypothetical protein